MRAPWLHVPGSSDAGRGAGIASGAHSYRGSDAVNLVHSGAEGDKKALVVFFDKQKIVHDFTMSTSRINVSQGLITR